MVRINALLAATIAGLFACAANAHPGEDHRIRAAERYSFLKGAAHTNLDHCADRVKALEFRQRSMERRQILAEELRREAGFEDSKELFSFQQLKTNIDTFPGPFKKRDLGTLLNVSHEISPVELLKNPSSIFKDNSTCVLQPDAILGPYCEYLSHARYPNPL
jgi:hypothetical protein